MSTADTGIVFPSGPDGSRSTSALGRSVVTDALRDIDPAGARSAERETNWRHGYTTHFRRLTVAGIDSRDTAVQLARDGLSSLHDRMRVVNDDGAEEPLDVLCKAQAQQVPATETVTGTAEAEEDLAIPYRGRRLAGDDLRRQLSAWVEDGIIHQTCADAVIAVADNPGWLRLSGQTVAVLGAGAEMGPLGPLLRWGATVAGIDLPRREVWERVLGMARQGAGTLHLPVTGEDGDLEDRAGLDLITDVPAAAEWVADLEGQLTLGNYVYADGATHVRVATAVDVLTLRLQDARDDVALAFLATPTDVFAVPREVVEESVAAYENRSTTARLVGRPLRTLSAGRLLRRGYVPDADPGICDALVPQQGPNYALAKRLHRWRSAVAMADGGTVSMHVAPATRTRSVIKNRALKAAYAGAHRFGVEVFDPETTNTLMAALLVHDLQTGGQPLHEHVWQDEAHEAAHGGLWTSPYAPPSALGLAALLGIGAAR